MKNIFKFALVFIAIESKAQCVPELLSIPNPTINHCIIVPNSDQYWASPFWWDENNQLHDLPEGEIDINLNFIDTCPNNTTVRCLLYLDLNNDGLQETVIDSDNPPAAGLVDVGNALGTGVMQFFDNRLLPSQEKWKFDLETVKSANNTTVSLRWTSAATKPATATGSAAAHSP